MLTDVDSEGWTTRQRDALLGMVPVVTFSGSFALGGWLAAFLDVPNWLGGVVLAVAGFFVSRAILRRAFAPKTP